MQKADLTYFKDWFKQYVARFYSSEREGQDAISLKEQHTERTCKEILTLGCELGLPEPDLLLAESAALFHDIGRFSQWQMYRTFIDSESEDHALIGLRELSRHGVLGRLSPFDRQVIQQSIRHHNVKRLSTAMAPRLLFFTRLLRDADKLDVWRVVIQYELRRDGMQEQALTGAIPAHPSCSARILADLRRGETPEFTSIVNQNDLRLVRLGWVFDLNFVPTCRKVLERRYTEQLCSRLPAIREIRQLRQDLIRYLKSRVSASRTGTGPF